MEGLKSAPYMPLHYCVHASMHGGTACFSFSTRAFLLNMFGVIRCCIKTIT
jgi:hypothetical protein